MECCRTSKRLQRQLDIKVIARRSRPVLRRPLALGAGGDAEEEQVEIVENHAPKRFVIENGKARRHGVRSAQVEFESKTVQQKSEVIDTIVIPCDDVILAIGQDNAFPWIERDCGITFDDRDMPVVDRATMQSSRAGVFFGGDAAWGPENIIWAVEHGHQAAISIHQHCEKASLAERPAQGMNLVSAKVGMHAWAVHDNDYNLLARAPR